MGACAARGVPWASGGGPGDGLAGVGQPGLLAMATALGPGAGGLGAAFSAGVPEGVGVGPLLNSCAHAARVLGGPAWVGCHQVAVLVGVP